MIHDTAARLLGALLLITSAALPHRTAADERFRAFKMKTLEGEQITLADLPGKATLVTFFFPSCRYCTMALPAIQKLHATYAAEGLSMVWINVVPEEDRLVAAWRTRHGIAVPVLLGGRSVQDDYNLAATPTHYLIDPQRKVLWKHAGYEPGDEQTLERHIRSALGLSD